MPEKLFKRESLSTGLLAALALTLAVSSALAAPGLGGGIVPHRAVYDLTLKPGTKTDRDISNVDGRLVFELTGADCVGYTIHTRFISRIMATNGRAAVSDIQALSWESTDGSLFTFSSQQFVNSDLREETKGQAERRGDGLVVKLEQPEESTFVAPGDVAFPTRHVVELLEAAAAGRRLLQVPIYDGSEQGLQVFETTAVIGEPRDDPAPGEEALAGGVLKGQRAWPISMAYFKGERDGEETPEYQQSFLLYANGVTGGLTLDYRDFVLSGKLSELDILDEAACE